MITVTKLAEIEAGGHADVRDLVAEVRRLRAALESARDSAARGGLGETDWPTSLDIRITEVLGDGDDVRFCSGCLRYRDRSHGGCE